VIAVPQPVAVTSATDCGNKVAQDGNSQQFRGLDCVAPDLLGHCHGQDARIKTIRHLRTRCGMVVDPPQGTCKKISGGTLEPPKAR